eukprot:CAMPEP_0197458722 /NCGR_PEP_ID=MMETSP1175-20131217/49431_1 /TAXON_ID=1003142 /ORGANISM="Triceratium dubium, Strain CCMP147" /LENGTH=299 /DNA_ID=CAMNT_0042993425 /DNA_START=72 /DNA_END=968 /DNA_ORIENTATION=-
MATNAFQRQMDKVCKADGFIAALDQSGGSTPKALRLYGIPDDAYVVGEKSMFDVIHDMRTRIITSPSFNGDRILGAILFENTMDRKIENKPTATYLWEEKGIVPFLKVDKGLAEEKNGVQLMKPIPEFDKLLKKGKNAGCFGTKMRSLIKVADADGIKAIVEQQFQLAKLICLQGLVPIIEPEVDINSPEKADAEDILKKEILVHLGGLDPHEKVMLKLTLPNIDNHYKECIEQANCIRVVALSGGYSREVANEHLSRQEGMIASFSRALTEGLRASDKADEFDSKLDDSIGSIFFASK